jgi:hypothetical protein
MSKRKPKHLGPQPSERRERQETPESRAFRAHMNVERLKEFKEVATTTPGPCYVCGCETTFGVGFWWPSPPYQRALGAPPGKTRLIGYRICESCSSKMGKEKEWVDAFVEAKAIAQHRGESVVYFGADGMPEVRP